MPICLRNKEPYHFVAVVAKVQKRGRIKWEKLGGKKRTKKKFTKAAEGITYLWNFISLGSKGSPASKESMSSVPLPRFLSLFSSLRYIFIICFSCSDWMVTWHPYAGLVISPLASRRANTWERDRVSNISWGYTHWGKKYKVLHSELKSINQLNTVGSKRRSNRGEEVVAVEKNEKN